MKQVKYTAPLVFCVYYTKIVVCIFVISFWIIYVKYLLTPKAYQQALICKDKQKRPIYLDVNYIKIFGLFFYLKVTLIKYWVSNCKSNSRVGKSYQETIQNIHSTLYRGYQDVLDNWTLGKWYKWIAKVFEQM